MLNSLFLQNKKNLLFIVLCFSFGCANLQTRRSGQQLVPPKQISAPADQSAALPQVDSSSGSIIAPSDDLSEVADQSMEPNPAFKEIRLGLILGPGGAKTYGHIGILKELQKRKIPIQMIAGLEWAALPAAIFASKGYVNDVEWQMMKMKEDEWLTSSFLSSKKSLPVGEVQDDLNKIFASLRVENLKHMFVCPAWNLDKKQTYLMQKGNLSQLLPFCLGYPPLFQPYQRNVAGLTDIKAITDYMHSKGVNYVLFVNVLDQALAMLVNDDVGASIAWSTILSQYQKQRNGIDEVIAVNLKNFQLQDFGKKREIMKTSSDLAEKAVGIWAKKQGF